MDEDKTRRYNRICISAIVICTLYLIVRIAF